MKRQGHPPYQEILFVDSSTGFKFVCGSTLQPKDTEEFEGKTYPVYRVAISSASHPFYTKRDQFVDTEGRLDKFKRRYSDKKQQDQQKKQQAAAEEAKKDKKKK